MLNIKKYLNKVLKNLKIFGKDEKLNKQQNLKYIKYMFYFV